MSLINITTLQEDKRLILPATAVTVALMLALPLVVHAVGGRAAGAVWLPLFYAPLLAALVCHPAVSLAAAVLAPLLNHALTGMPPLPTAVVLMVELVVFATAVQILHRRWPRFWGAAPVAYLLGKLAALLWLAVWPLLPVSAGAYFANSLSMAWPGLLVLLLINVLYGVWQRGQKQGETA